MKKLVGLAIALVVLLSITVIPANALVVGDWEIEISNGEAYIIGYNGTCPDQMTLPNKIGNFSVVGLKSNIFTENVTEITIPEGYKVVSAKKDTYQGKTFKTIKDSLEKISLPSTLEILDCHFQKFSKLKEIRIPGGVKEIGTSMFENCSALKYIYLENGVECIGVRAFKNCGNLVDFTIPDTVVEIGSEAFSNCDSLVNMVIPNSVHTFGRDYGSNIGLEDGPVFSGCDNLETVVIGDGIKILCTDHHGVRNGELSSCPKLKSVYIGNGVVEFQRGSILGKNNSLKTIIIPEGVKIIGRYAFENSNNLEAAVLPKSFSELNGRYKDEIPFYQYELFDPTQPLPKLYLYGYKGTYAETFANENGFPFVDISVATPTDSKVLIDGKQVAFTAYNIGGNNYFKLRDVAAAINGTSKNFNVGWDGNNNAIALTSKVSYNNVGGELAVNTSATVTEPQISNPKIFVDGKLTTFMAFNIADNNYIKLRDLGEVFDFDVDWNDSAQTIEITTSRGYSE